MVMHPKTIEVIYRMSHEQKLSVRQISRQLHVSRKAIRKYLPPQPGDVERTYADVTKAEVHLGYRPATSIQTGLARFVTWLRQSQHP